MVIHGVFAREICRGGNEKFIFYTRFSRREIVAISSSCLVWERRRLRHRSRAILFEQRPAIACFDICQTKAEGWSSSRAPLRIKVYVGISVRKPKLRILHNYLERIPDSCTVWHHTFRRKSQFVVVLQFPSHLLILVVLDMPPACAIMSSSVFALSAEILLRL